MRKSFITYKRISTICIDDMHNSLPLRIRHPSILHSIIRSNPLCIFGQGVCIQFPDIPKLMSSKITKRAYRSRIEQFSQSNRKTCSRQIMAQSQPQCQQWNRENKAKYKSNESCNSRSIRYLCNDTYKSSEC